MSPQELLDKTLTLMGNHLEQIRIQATHITKDGAKGLTGSDATVIEKYAKILLAMQKTPTDADSEFDNLSDEELQAKLNGSDTDVPDTDSET